jgi:hypothetical protein
MSGRSEGARRHQVLHGRNAILETGARGSTDARRFGWAWLGLTTALALHVTDEALTNFLSLYNPSVLALRQRVPWLPLPTFTFRVWLTGLIAGICLLVFLSRFADQGKRWAVVLAYPLSVLMVFNGLGQIGGSLYSGRLMPGVYSSPLLLIASVSLLLTAVSTKAS